MDYITSQTPDKGVQIGPEPPISNDSIALTPDKGVQIGKELPIINASTALIPDKGVQIGPEPPISNGSIAMAPDKGVQVGPEPAISNDSIAMTSDTVPGFAGNFIEAGIVLNGTKSAVYKSAAYPANADGKQRPGAVVEYSSEFSVGEGFSVGGVKSELPAGYIAAEFLESIGTQYIITDIKNNTSLSVEIDCSIIQGNASYPNLAFLCGCEVKDNVGFQMPLVKQGYNGGGYRARCGYNQLISNKWQAAFDVRNKVKNSLMGYIINGDKVHDWEDKTEWETTSFINLFTDTTTSMLTAMRARWFSAEMINSDVKRSLKPCIDVAGVPCMFDKVSSTAFKNSGTGQFIVGMTLHQALNLRKLPTTGGALTISLPEGYDSNAGVMTALETARSKGWTLTIQTYTPESTTEAASTFALRRIWVRKTQDEQGGYVDADEKRWQVDWCVDMLTPDGSTPDAYGYEMFRNVDAAVAYWELTPYVDPETEEEFSQEL